MHYALMTKTKESNAYLNECREEYRKVLELIPDLPLSNLWIARQISHLFPKIIFASGHLEFLACMECV